MYWHITIASAQRLALFPSESHRLAAARALARAGGDAMLLFCVADDHLHMLVASDEPARLATNLSFALRPLCASPLAVPYVGTVRDRNHLRSLVGYILDQTSHHVLHTAEHPAVWPGSAFPALVGARFLPGLGRAALTEALPRLTDADLFAAVRLPVVAPCSDDALADLGAGLLARRVAETLGQDALDERRANGGRALLAHLATRFGVGAPRIAQVLGTTERQVRRLAAQDPDPSLDRALRTWVSIRVVAARPPSIGRPADLLDEG